MIKEELLVILQSEFWDELKVRLNNERNQIVSDIVAADLSTEAGIGGAVKGQAKIEAFDKIEDIVQEMKEEARNG